MATDIERLIVTLEARTKEYERALAKAQGTTVTALRKIERDTQAHAAKQQATLARMGAGVQQTIQRSLIAPLAAFAGAAGIRQVTALVDTFTRMENAMKVAGVPAQELAGTLDELFAIASKHGAPVEALTTLYGRLALVQGELNLTSADLLSFSDNVAAALRVSGKSAAEASGALLQLSQALGSGVVRAEEFNSMLEGAPAIVQAAARGIEEAGGSVARLRQLVLDGAITSDVFFRGFQAGAAETQRQASQAEKTVAQAMENIRTAFIKAAGSIDEMTGASDALVGALEEVSTQIGHVVANIDGLKRVGSGLVGFFDDLDAGLRQFGRDIGIAAPLGSELDEARATLAEYLRYQDEAVAAGNDALARHYGDLARVIIAKINAMDPGPAWEQKGREGAQAFEKGFATVSIQAPAVASAAPVVTGGLSATSHRVPGANGPVPVTITRPVGVEPAGIRAGMAGVESTLDRGFGAFDRHGNRIADHTGRTADGVNASGERITGAIGQQTGALVGAFQAAARTAGTMGGGPGAWGGSAGGSQAMRFSVNVAAQRQLDKLADERQVLQAGMGVKQLSPQEERDVQLRLAQIDLESARLNQHMGEVAAAFQDLRPMISQMLLAGWDFEQVVGALNSELRRRFRASGQNFFSSTAIPQFAGGGPVTGPGGPRSDSVPIMASAGEYVVNAAATKKHRALLDAINSGAMRTMADGGLVGRVNAAAQRLANGGMVGGGMVRAAPAAARREVNAPIHITVMAQDADSFRRSERDLGRRIAAEVEYHLHGNG